MEKYDRTLKESHTFLSRWSDSQYERITAVTASHRSLQITLFRDNQNLIITCGYPEYLRGNFEWTNPRLEASEVYWEPSKETLLRFYDFNADFEVICHSLKFIERV